MGLLIYSTFILCFSPQNDLIFSICIYFVLSVNLSIADTMVSSLNVTFNFVYMLNGHWPFGNIYCKVCGFISIISVCGSVFTMVAISADRLVRILLKGLTQKDTFVFASEQLL